MNRCVVENCLRERMADALVCRAHLGDLWSNRLDRSPSGYAEPVMSPFVRRALAHKLPAKAVA